MPAFTLTKNHLDRWEPSPSVSSWRAIVSHRQIHSGILGRSPLFSKFILFFFNMTNEFCAWAWGRICYPTWSDVSACWPPIHVASSLRWPALFGQLWGAAVGRPWHQLPVPPRAVCWETPELFLPAVSLTGGTLASVGSHWLITVTVLNTFQTAWGNNALSVGVVSEKCHSRSLVGGWQRGIFPLFRCHQDVSLFPGCPPWLPHREDTNYPNPDIEGFKKRNSDMPLQWQLCKSGIISTCFAYKLLHLDDCVG